MLIAVVLWLKVLTIAQPATVKPSGLVAVNYRLPGTAGFLFLSCLNFIMYKVLFAICCLVSVGSADAQNLKNLVKNPLQKDSAGNLSVSSILSGNGADIAGGLKEALNKGIETGTAQLSATDGFFKNAAVKILLPSEAQKAEKTLRSIGLDKQVDDAILTMNRAAEDAAKSAAPIFFDAVKNMTITDAANILKGNDSAATTYLQARTSSALTAAFRPVVDRSLAKVDATKYWTTITTSYNKMPLVKQVNTDLIGYVTGKALQGLFHEIALQEKEIRDNPAARTTDLLKKVFAKQ